MSAQVVLDEDELALLHEPQIAVLSTVMPDGSPQSSPVWVDTDGEVILFNIIKGRVKHQNIVRDNRVAVTVVDRNDPYRTLIVRGLAELVAEGANDHIDALSMKYLGVTAYPLHRPGWERIIVRVTLTSKFNLMARRTPDEWTRLGKQV